MSFSSINATQPNCSPKDSPQVPTPVKTAGRALNRVKKLVNQLQVATEATTLSPSEAEAVKLPPDLIKINVNEEAKRIVLAWLKRPYDRANEHLEVPAEFKQLKANVTNIDLNYMPISQDTLNQIVDCFPKLRNLSASVSEIFRKFD